MGKGAPRSVHHGGNIKGIFNLLIFIEVFLSLVSV